MKRSSLPDRGLLVGSSCVSSAIYNNAPIWAASLLPAWRLVPSSQPSAPFRFVKPALVKLALLIPSTGESMLARRALPQQADRSLRTCRLFGSYPAATVFEHARPGQTCARHPRGSIAGRLLCRPRRPVHQGADQWGFSSQ